MSSLYSTNTTNRKLNYLTGQRILSFETCLFVVGKRVRILLSSLLKNRIADESKVEFCLYTLCMRATTKPINQETAQCLRPE